MIECSQIQWGLTTLPYMIRRTERAKTVALTIAGRGKLVVTAPEGVSIDTLNGIVMRKGEEVGELRLERRRTHQLADHPGSYPAHRVRARARAGASREPEP